MQPSPLHAHEADDALLDDRKAVERLVAQGSFAEARERLGPLLARHPGDDRARGLLGLCCFRLGRLEEAATLYRQLVIDNPDDATLLVNLGLVELKRGQATVAAGHLEAALALEPNHHKARNYLGLALAQAGQTARAREAFVAAGSQAVAERLEAGEAAGEAGVRSGDAAPTLEALAASTALHWPEGGTFALGPGCVAARFDTGLHTRLDGLVAAHGAAAWTPLAKRFRGAEVDRPFGAGPLQLWRATGTGRLLFSATGRVFTRLRAPSDLFLVEERLFAFEEGTDWENGRLPGQAADLHLARLTGRGELLLVTERPVRSEQVRDGCLSLPVSGLVGWSGPLSPRLVAGEEGPAMPWVELSGSGTVLLLA